MSQSFSLAQVAFLATLCEDGRPMVAANGAHGDSVIASLVDRGLAKRAADRRYVIPSRDGILTYCRMNKQPVIIWPP